MKVRLLVNGEAFVIEECEGAPEIRREAAAKSTADRRCEARAFSGEQEQQLLTIGIDPYVSLKVEAL